MKIKHLIYIISSIIPFSLYAQEKNDRFIEIMGSVGFSYYSGYPTFNTFDQSLKDQGISGIDTSEADMPYGGLNAGAAAFYSIIKTDIGYPVIGAGFDYTYNVGHKSVDKYYNIGRTSSTKDGKSQSLFLDLYGGFNFTIFDRLNLFALANFGYSIYDKASQNEDFYYYNYSPIFIYEGHLTNDYNIKNHMKIGFSGIATYDLTEKVGIGAGLDINSHSFNATGSTNYRAGAVKNIDLSAQFTEVILKFIMSYSI